MENHLAYYKLPAHIVRMEAFPMNASGKVMLGELKKKAAEIIPVSYTHLDVYKRQTLCSLNGAEHRFLPCLLRFFTNPGRMGQLSPAIK